MNIVLSIISSNDALSILIWLSKDVKSVFYSMEFTVYEYDKRTVGAVEMTSWPLRARSIGSFTQPLSFWVTLLSLVLCLVCALGHTHTDGHIEMLPSQHYCPYVERSNK